MNVLKFGGTSVGSAQRIQEVAKLISDDQPKIVVLSAMSGTTNTLVDITNSIPQWQAGSFDGNPESRIRLPDDH